MKKRCFLSFRFLSTLFLTALVVLTSLVVLVSTGCSEKIDLPTPEETATEQTTTEQPATEESVTEEVMTEELLTEEFETEETVTESVSKENFPWRNADVVFVGDSITAGRNTTKAYHSYLKDMGVFKSVKAQGRGGSCISTQSDYGLEKYPLTQRYNSIPAADLIVIFMGTNDYGHETPLGSISDTSDISFYGALNVVITGLREKYPDSQIVFVTPLHRYGFGKSESLGTKFSYDNLPNGEGKSLGDYVDAIKAIAGKYSLPVIDLFNLYPFNPEKPEDKQKYFPDGLHPNEEGHKILADMILEQLALIPN